MEPLAQTWLGSEELLLSLTKPSVVDCKTKFSQLGTPLDLLPIPCLNQMPNSTSDWAEYTEPELQVSVH